MRTIESVKFGYTVGYVALFVGNWCDQLVRLKGLQKNIRRHAFQLLFKSVEFLTQDRMGQPIERWQCGMSSSRQQWTCTHVVIVFVLLDKRLGQLKLEVSHSLTFLKGSEQYTDLRLKWFTRLLERFVFKSLVSKLLRASAEVGRANVLLSRYVLLEANLLSRYRSTHIRRFFSSVKFLNFHRYVENVCTGFAQ